MESLMNAALALLLREILKRPKGIKPKIVVLVRVLEALIKLMKIP
jgi:hypothetical protein